MENLQQLQLSIVGYDLNSAGVAFHFSQCFYESVWGIKNQLLKQQILNLEWKITS